MRFSRTYHRHIIFSLLLLSSLLLLLKGTYLPKGILLDHVHVHIQQNLAFKEPLRFSPYSKIVACGWCRTRHGYFIKHTGSSRVLQLVSFKHPKGIYLTLSEIETTWQRVLRYIESLMVSQRHNWSTLKDSNSSWTQDWISKAFDRKLKNL